MKLCICLNCSKEFTTIKRKSNFCCPNCRASDYAKKHKQKVDLYKKQYYEQNKDSLNKQNMDRYYLNKPQLEQRFCYHCRKEYQPTRSDRKFCSNECGVVFWRNSNSTQMAEYFKDKYHNDLNYRLSMCLRSRLNKALKGNIKSQGTMTLLGCSIEEFKQYLKSKFEPWMNWDNYGMYDPNKPTWQIDHIKPLKLFDLSNPKQQEEACNYINLQPILAKNNLIKGSKYE